MGHVRRLAFASLAAAALVSGPARANTCQAGGLTCATTMPPGGYCECTARGATESGTVVSRRGPNSTAGGCGAHPDAPGCR